MFALFAFGYVFGFVGLLLAVPLAAATGVLSRFALNKYLTSPLYQGRRCAIPQNAPCRKRSMTVERSSEGGRQLVFDLPQRPAFGREDFLVTAANAQAVASIDRWPDWLESGACPARCRRAAASPIWPKSGADARALASAAPMTFASRLVPRLLAEARCGDRGCPGRNASDEKALFHLLNAAREHGGYAY